MESEGSQRKMQPSDLLGRYLHLNLECLGSPELGCVSLESSAFCPCKRWHLATVAMHWVNLMGSAGGF